MAGIYIHIPFCKQACHYCNFHFSTNHKSIPQMQSALLQELENRKTEFANQIIETIYFGGGTPGLLDAELIQEILQNIQENYDAKNILEITIEVNPDDMTAKKLESYIKMGIDRLSIGTQSFFEEDLQYMHRSHDAEAAKKCIQLAQQIGFNNISADLIYGYPLLTNEKWKYNFFEAIAQGITHISCYAMTVEPKTALQKMITQNKVADIDNSQSGEQFQLLMQWAKDINWDHYEISNFAAPNHRAKHNTNYWHGKNYIGIGPSAHSFDGENRSWNIANNALYIKGIENNLPISESENLSEFQKLNEYIMTNIRLKEGINLETIKQKCSEADWKIFLEEFSLHQHFFEVKNYMASLTNEGKLFADKVASDLFFI